MVLYPYHIKTKHEKPQKFTYHLTGLLSETWCVGAGEPETDILLDIERVGVGAGATKEGETGEYWVTVKPEGVGDVEVEFQTAEEPLRDAGDVSEPGTFSWAACMLTFILHIQEPPG